MPYTDLRKGRCSLAHHAYFITTVTHLRQPWFRDWKVGRLVCLEMRRLEQQGLLESLAWVLMPDHLHWLFRLDADAQIASIMRRLKGVTARKINQRLVRRGSVWQSAYYDHAVRQDEDLRAVARYIIANPLRAGLVEQIGEYPLWDAVWL
jgi:REP element-mobilizing transposase RayT